MVVVVVVASMQDLLGQRNRKQTKIYDPHSSGERQEDQDGGRAAAKAKRVRLKCFGVLTFSVGLDGVMRRRWFGLAQVGLDHRALVWIASR